MTPEERAEVVQWGGRPLPTETRAAIAAAIREAVAAERGRWAELLAAADDAVETFEAGGMPGGPVLRLREAVRRVREGGA